MRNTQRTRTIIRRIGVKLGVTGLIWWTNIAIAASADVEFDIAPLHYNRIGLAGEPIDYIRYEDMDCAVDVRPDTGDIYLYPLVNEPFSVFVTSVSGKTKSVRLNPVAKHRQNIEIELRKAAKPKIVNQLSTSKKSRMALDAKKAMQNQAPDGFFPVKGRIPKLKTPTLWLKPVNGFESPQGRWAIYDAYNRTRHAVSLDSWDWVPKGIDAVNAAHHQIAPHGHVRVALFWQEKNRG